MSNEEKDITQEESTNEQNISNDANENIDNKEENLAEKLAEINDKYIRLYSEFDNFRKRTAKERIELIGTASEKIIKDLLPILDDFKRAQKSNIESNDIEAVKKGFDLIYDKLNKTLTNSGLKPMEAHGQPFDADIHEALTNIPSPSEEMKGKVIDVVEDGYYLNDKIIRFAKVVVGN
jgi:molecular chaperone GrpE